MSESINERINRLTAERKSKEKHSPPPQQTALPPASDPEPLSDKDSLRRARTHRLVQIGALTDQYLGTGELPPEEAGEKLAKIAALPQVRDLLK